MYRDPHASRLMMNETAMCFMFLSHRKVRYLAMLGRCIAGMRRRQSVVRFRFLSSPPSSSHFTSSKPEQHFHQTFLHCFIALLAVHSLASPSFYNNTTFFDSRQPRCNSVPRSLLALPLLRRWPMFLPLLLRLRLLMIILLLLATSTSRRSYPTLKPQMLGKKSSTASS